MTQEQYAELFSAGIEGVTVYQETYNRRLYDYYHRGGAKADYDYRLKVTDDIARAKMREIGLGALLGLTDFRSETLALAEHVNYLMKHYWQCHVSVSFPRLRPAESVNSQQFTHLLSDKNIVQMLLALRLCFADVGLVLSTREPGWLRDHLVQMGITKMSAGSKTSPGGYSCGDRGLEQFEVNDNRTPGEITQMLRQHGLEPVWKDWDAAFQAS
jgi:2-iminoacetate synthase